MQNKAVIKKLKLICKTISKEEDLLLIEKYSFDWRNKYRNYALCISFPKTKSELAKLLKFCNKHSLTVIPQGGNTGLVGGSAPIDNNKSIIINLEKMNNIINIDIKNNFIECEAGAILATVINECKKLNYFFPINISSSGSCQIGGLVATNAGGINVIKYGSIRNNILDLEVALANGKILNMGSKVVKDNTGYSLKDIFCGSEGTLGIISKVSIKIYPKSGNNLDFFLSFENLKSLFNAYHLIQSNFSGKIEACELISDYSFVLCLRYKFIMRSFFKNKSKYYMLIKFNINEDKNYFIENFYSILSKLNDDITEILVSQSSRQSEEFWNFRHNLTEAQKKDGKLVAFDISIPIDKLEIFLQEAKKNINKLLPHINYHIFGHLGDSNIHFNLIEPHNYTDDFHKNEKDFNNVVYELLMKYGGSISAEHGIGQLKKKDLKITKSKIEISTMKSIKKTLDPKSILNPGKIF